MAQGTKSTKGSGVAKRAKPPRSVKAKRAAARSGTPKRRAEPATLALAALNPDAAFFELRLYVAGNTEKSVRAVGNLRELCETHLKGRYRIELIDLLRNPTLARGDQIFAIPTLVRRLPEPMKKIIGDLSNTERVLVGLDLRPLPPSDPAR